jgi:HlyD family secretion protein
MTEGQIRSARAPVLMGLATLIVLIGGFGVWSVSTSIAGAVVAPGRIEVESNRQIVQHIDGGQVDSIHVAEGQTVQAGDLLLRLNGSALRSEYAIVEGQFLEVLAQRGRLEAERDDADQIVFPPELVAEAGRTQTGSKLITAQRQLFDARRATLNTEVEQLWRRRDQIRSQIGGITAQAEALSRQLGLIAEELETQQKLLAKGLGLSGPVLALQREEERLRGQAGELQAAQAQSEGRIIEIELEVLRLRADRREQANRELNSIANRELELAERRRALQDRIARLDITAPVSGIVLGLQVTTPKAVLRAAEPVLYLIPQDRPLVIAARIALIDIDQVQVGQEVKLVFSAFSSRTTPEVLGRVAVLSADALSDESSRQGYYRAEIALKEGESEKLQGLTLLPGMPVEAFIRTEAHTPLQYLTKPFTAYFARAFRES